MAHHVIVLAVYLPAQYRVAVLFFSAMVAVGGLLWARLYEKSGSLYAPWLSHLIVDVALMVIGYDLMWGGRV